MFSKVVVFAAVIAAVRAGVAPAAYGATTLTAGPAVGYAGAYAAAPLAHHAYAAAPVAHHAYAAAPVAHHAYAAPAVFAGSVGAQSEHTVRGFGGLSTVSHQAKAVHTPYSHVHKTDTRITNDAVHAYAAPVAHAYAAPAIAAAPLAHHAIAPAAYAAPIAHAPAAYAAPIAHHGLAHGYAAGLAPAKSLSYSPVSPAVATLSYSTPYFTYGY